MAKEVTEATRRLLEKRSGGICELCRSARATNVHHRLPRGMGGTTRNIHTAEWLLHLCGSGTTGCHGMIERDRERAYSNGWLLRQHEDAASTHVRIFGAIVYLTPDGHYEPFGAKGWRMEPATPVTSGASPDPSSSTGDPSSATCADTPSTCE